jgi:hypothetical protein
MVCSIYPDHGLFVAAGIEMKRQSSISKQFRLRKQATHIPEKMTAMMSLEH